MKIWSLVLAAATTAAQQIDVDWTLTQTGDGVLGVLNEAETAVRVSVANHEPVTAQISEVVAMWQSPGKHRPKPYLNLSIPVEGVEIASGSVSELDLSTVYSIKTGNYLLDFAIKTTLGDEPTEYVIGASKLASVRVVDPVISYADPAFLTSLLVLGAVVYFVMWLAVNVAPPGWFEARLPTVAHRLLPAHNDGQRRKKRE